MPDARQDREEPVDPGEEAVDTHPEKAFAAAGKVTDAKGAALKEEGEGEGR